MQMLQHAWLNTLQIEHLLSIFRKVIMQLTSKQLGSEVKQCIYCTRQRRHQVSTNLLQSLVPNVQTVFDYNMKLGTLSHVNTPQPDTTWELGEMKQSPQECIISCIKCTRVEDHRGRNEAGCGIGYCHWSQGIQLSHNLPLIQLSISYRCKQCESCSETNTHIHIHTLMKSIRVRMQLISHFVCLHT